ncbi:UNKNOWN [Stylonychia lemnae]|uniref:Uncharacterized protein n=1 Tax=Stylonychia lemnae TaxID=5949 RepID=A0A078AYD2_STYLE|nr:UNKNOWN [Stylonychia lemnae]|eukprot:CDW87174.1 UNKNOWN [Stylonychia lemnae]
MNDEKLRLSLQSNEELRLRQDDQQIEPYMRINNHKNNNLISSEQMKFGQSRVPNIDITQISTKQNYPKNDSNSLLMPAPNMQPRVYATNRDAQYNSKTFDMGLLQHQKEEGNSIQDDKFVENLNKKQIHQLDSNSQLDDSHAISQYQASLFQDQGQTEMGYNLKSGPGRKPILMNESAMKRPAYKLMIGNVRDINNDLIQQNRDQNTSVNQNNCFNSSQESQQRSYMKDSVRQDRGNPSINVLKSPQEKPFYPVVTEMRKLIHILRKNSSFQNLSESLSNLVENYHHSQNSFIQELFKQLLNQVHGNDLQATTQILIILSLIKVDNVQKPSDNLIPRLDISQSTPLSPQDRSRLSDQQRIEKIINETISVNPKKTFDSIDDNDVDIDNSPKSLLSVRTLGQSNMVKKSLSHLKQDDENQNDFMHKMKQNERKKQLNTPIAAQSNQFSFKDGETNKMSNIGKGQDQNSLSESKGSKNSDQIQNFNTQSIVVKSQKVHLQANQKPPIPPNDTQKKDPNSLKSQLNDARKQIENKINLADQKIEQQIKQRKMEQGKDLVRFFKTLGEEIKNSSQFKHQPNIQSIQLAPLYEKCVQQKLVKEQFKDFIISEFRKQTIMMEERQRLTSNEPSSRDSSVKKRKHNLFSSSSQSNINQDKSHATEISQQLSHANSQSSLNQPDKKIYPNKFATNPKRPVPIEVINEKDEKDYLSDDLEQKSHSKQDKRMYFSLFKVDQADMKTNTQKVSPNKVPPLDLTKLNKKKK